MITTTKDNKELPLRIWVYLTDWNDKDEWATIWSKYSTNDLSDLTKAELLDLFSIAFNSDYNG